ncbi:hypothetical protein [uncultured Pontibacter sp.]|uniref:hypothetical protein n=1 Tax=uncultured Pontibacter sp. TaxID=453356 RepID=UPI00261650A0|nr:hypothetical protein [uncultured Pontibacter sp.]
MKKKINILATILISATMALASCGGGEYGENAEMPPESTTGETNETGVDGSGDLPGTGADSSHINDKLSGDTTLQQQ